MATAKQKLGAYGEKLVASTCACPKCKSKKTLKRLPTNFKCADVICDLCGFLAQVKAVTVKDKNAFPNRVLGAAWKPQKERMDKGIYIPLFLVLKEANKKGVIYYLSADTQTPKIFIKRKPLSSKARRAGWQGFVYDLRNMSNLFVKIT